MILLCMCLLLLFISDKSKRRTKTVKKTLEPKWNQTFVYSHVHRRDFREHMLEITVWDQPKVQDEESSFLGEASRTCVSISTLLLWLSLSNSLPFFPPHRRFWLSWRPLCWTISLTGTSCRLMMCPLFHCPTPHHTCPEDTPTVTHPLKSCSVSGGQEV